ncbi:RagB/SusD family nutrient uptake outer membrane protein [Runella sp. MFBS21]|uniref:RagB/SusD family nutrient uptake outer membrane protein n=1 Tax=Runella sp. MFBS21 TaxID=3034018 RepID=UPI0023F7796F|nr:RagB/SusD family nutrient uptake outer membrane protein [Runella sp. MFBS21]MDF7820014.1 RagB/SusD family nutrient uptake outer membrane protein [Runella sp. MFBS21]
MKRITYKSIKGFFLLTALLFSQACDESVLDEKPLSFLSPDVTLVSNAGFQSAITALHQAVREVAGVDDQNAYWSVYFGTDLGSIGVRDAYLRNYETQLTPTFMGVNHFWDWGYLNLLPRANQIIDYAQRPTAVWADEKQKNAVIAEARFFRAYAHNMLTNLYGDVVIADKLATEPKVDYQRNKRKEVLEFAKADLEFASQWLPLTEPQPGRIVKSAADHLLTEVNISLGNYDKAIETATAVISSGRNQLMTQRFGTQKNLPGDVYSDLWKDGNQNRSGGNLENLWVIQYEFQTPGGVTSSGNGRNWLRCWGARYFDAKDPDNASGMVIADSLGRGVSWMRPSNHILYDIWKDDPNDMRNSEYNIRRKWYYNNPASKYFLKEVKFHANLDTLYHIYPAFRKVEGLSLAGATNGRTFNDWPMMRLAETYLLRAEAYLMKGDKQKAAEDINVVRGRAKAKPVAAAQVDLDYILDERLRELIVEEPRRLTLSRMGKLVERTKKYNGFATTTSTIQAKNELFPIPQKFIDANFGAKVPQNPGY